jgi:hypothetical protein
MAPCYTLMPPQANFLSTLQREARRLQHPRVARAQAHGEAPPVRSRLAAECLSAAQSWTQPWRVGLKAAGMRAGAHPRFVVTSLGAPTPPMVSADLSGARGPGAHDLKAVQHALRRARTAATTCLAHAMRLIRACAASALHQAWRTHTLHHSAPHRTARDRARPRERRRRPRPSSCASATSPHRSHRPRSVSSSICPVPAPSKRADSGSPPCDAPSRHWPPTRRDVRAVPRRDRLQAHRAVHATPRCPQQGAAPDSRHAPTGEGRACAAANPASPPQSGPETARTAPQSPARLLIRAEMHSHRCSTTVYEISRLVRLSLRVVLTR